MARAALGTVYRHIRDLFEGGTTASVGDGELLSRYSRSNDEAAFEALVDRHGPMVLATCRAVLRNDHDVDDAFQATFLILARKAGSVRGADALGGWLHRVAYRASVQARLGEDRRRRHEAARSLMTPAGSHPEPDWKPVLHEEIGRLPTPQRLPVVLCDLEGLTYEQAAGQLGWTLPTLRCRLARGRQRLRDRLIRRGVTAPGLGGLLTSQNGPAMTAPPAPALVRATVVAAAGGAASAGAKLLARTLMRGMLMTRIATISTAALALVAAGLFAAGAGPGDDPRPAMKPKTSGQAAGKEPAHGKPAEMVEVRGIVVDPDGRPVAGAVVQADYLDVDSSPTRATSRSQTDGRFAVRMPKPRWSGDWEETASYPWIIASAPGYGIGWIEGVLRAGRPAEQVVKLVPEGPPIEGRLIDLEGRPVAAARVKLDGFLYEKNGDLAGWIARARNGAEGDLRGLEHLMLEVSQATETVTGPDGRFRLGGVGRDRIAHLLITGKGIATTPVLAFSRAEAELRIADRQMMEMVPQIVHAPKFQLALLPSKRVEGIARDQDSGRPIAGLKIEAAVFDEQNMIAADGIESTTDARGRYRLDGLPRATAYRLFIAPAAGLPYVHSTLEVPADSPAFDPVAFDFRLKRGVFVRGKLTEKGTGRPVVGMASYYAFVDNPHLREYAGFSENRGQYGEIDEEGRYSIVVLPGRGLIGVQDSTGRYRPAVGYEKIAGYEPRFQVFQTVPEAGPARLHASLVEINPAPDHGETILDLQADPGRSVAVEVVGPDGRPVEGTTVKGMGPGFGMIPLPQESARFEIRALAPKEPRRVVVTHEPRKLIGSVLLRGDEAGPVVVKLQPWGSLSGRIVDDEGHPRKSMFISSPSGSENWQLETHDILPGSDSGVRVGDDGRFRVVGLVPGLRYSAISRTGFEAFGGLFTDVAVAPGEARDLGDLKVQLPKKRED